MFSLNIDYNIGIKMAEISCDNYKNRNSNSEIISPNCGAQSLLRERQTFTLERREKKRALYSVVTLALRACFTTIYLPPRLLNGQKLYRFIELKHSDCFPK